MLLGKIFDAIGVGDADVDRIQFSWRRTDPTTMGYYDKDGELITTVEKFSDAYQPHVQPETLKYLDSLMNTQMTMLEFGSGESTIWFGRRVKQLYTVEDHPDWFQLVNMWVAWEDLSNVRTIWKCLSEPSMYHSFDIVFVDNGNQGEGPCYKRLATAAEALFYVKPEGTIIIDDQKWEHFALAGEVVENHGWICTKELGDQKTKFYKRRK